MPGDLFTPVVNLCAVDQRRTVISRDVYKRQKFHYKMPSPIGFQLAPMLDIVFLLLVFFIVTQTLSLIHIYRGSTPLGSTITRRYEPYTLSGTYLRSQSAAAASSDACCRCCFYALVACLWWVRCKFCIAYH